MPETRKQIYHFIDVIVPLLAAARTRIRAAPGNLSQFKNRKFK